jgi:hypothetical protein
VQRRFAIERLGRADVEELPVGQCDEILAKDLPEV